MKKNILPEWYPAPLHQRQLSMQEWAIEVFYRSFAIYSYLDNKEVAKRNGLDHFEDLIIKGNRDNYKLKLSEYNDFPVSLLKTKAGKKEGLIKLPHIEMRDNGRIVPVLLNLDYDDETILKTVKSMLKDRRRHHKEDPAEQLIGTHLASTPFAPKKPNFSLPMNKASKPYQQHHIDTWHEYRVLDFIDITFWGLISDTKYQDTFLFREFWPADYSKKHDSLETTKRWAYELLHPKASRRLRASGQKF